MAKFHFKLETVLRHRQAVEDQRQRELAQLLRQRMILHDQLRLMQQTISQSKRDLSGTLTGRVNMDQVGGFARFSGQVTQRAEAMVLRLSGLEKQIDTARQRLLEATRGRKAMDLLKERHLALWHSEQDRREAANLDEAALQLFVRGRTLELNAG